MMKFGEIRLWNVKNFYSNVRREKKLNLHSDFKIIRIQIKFSNLMTIDSSWLVILMDPWSETNQRVFIVPNSSRSFKINVLWNWPLRSAGTRRIICCFEHGLQQWIGTMVLLFADVYTKIRSMWPVHVLHTGILLTFDVLCFFVV